MDEVEEFPHTMLARQAEAEEAFVVRIYRREDGVWKIVHRHGDNPGDDPR